MKVFVICSKKFYSKIDKIKDYLENKGHEVYLPNCYDKPDTEAQMWELGRKVHQEFKAQMYKQSEDVIASVDAVLVLNYDKVTPEVTYKNYIGGATFLEMYDAFRLGKKIYMLNEIPKGLLYDEIEGFGPIILNGNIENLETDLGYYF
ncbi:MAG: hypothetical protein E7167_00405 [Firmicutes bacterium]|nr:hypothetical protein [Bacillota bacterium]